jgi:hypothetical protein
MGDFILKYWIEFLFGLVVSGMGFAVKRVSQKLNEQEAIKFGVQALLRDRIIQAYHHYKDKGYCPIYARDNIIELVNQYHNLGGNGIIDDLFDKIKMLPTESQERQFTPLDME